MSVLIKGLEMPKDGEHPYWVTIHSDGTVEYNENKGQGWQTSEAVPVPTHGRLIDADALEEYFVNDPSCLTIFDAIEKLQGMPTIILAEPPKDETPTGPYDLLYEEGGADA